MLQNNDPRASKPVECPSYFLPGCRRNLFLCAVQEHGVTFVLVRVRPRWYYVPFVLLKAEWAARRTDHPPIRQSRSARALSPVCLSMAERV